MHFHQKLHLMPGLYISGAKPDFIPQLAVGSHAMVSFRTLCIAVMYLLPKHAFKKCTSGIEVSELNDFRMCGSQTEKGDGNFSAADVCN